MAHVAADQLAVNDVAARLVAVVAVGADTLEVNWLPVKGKFVLYAIKEPLPL